MPDCGRWLHPGRGPYTIVYCRCTDVYCTPVAGGWTHGGENPNCRVMTTAQYYFAVLYADLWPYVSDPILMKAAGLVLMVVAFWMVIILAIMHHN
jgi:hypothetical protein